MKLNDNHKDELEKSNFENQDLDLYTNHLINELLINLDLTINDFFGDNDESL